MDDDVGIIGGEMFGIIGGINWYLNNYICMMLNYGYLDVDEINGSNNGDGEV